MIQISYDLLLIIGFLVLAFLWAYGSANRDTKKDLRRRLTLRDSQIKILNGKVGKLEGEGGRRDTFLRHLHDGHYIWTHSHPLWIEKADEDPERTWYNLIFLSGTADKDVNNQLASLERVAAIYPYDCRAELTNYRPGFRVFLVQALPDQGIDTIARMIKSQK